MNESMTLAKWEVDIGQGYQSCEAAPWNLPAGKGGIGAIHYCGYGKYRTRIIIPSGWKGEQLAVFFQGIDDADVTFFNGKEIGRTGSFPKPGTRYEGYISSWSTPRVYPLPESLIYHDSENVLEVNVYSPAGKGGLVGSSLPEIGNLKQLEKRADGITSFINIPRIVVLTLYSLFFFYFIIRVMQLIKPGFVGYSMTRLINDLNPVSFLYRKIQKESLEAHLLHELCFKYMCIIIILILFVVYIFYELVFRNSVLAGMAIYGVKYHTQVLYLGLSALIFVIYHEIFASSDDSDSRARLNVIIPRIITHPILFLCYTAYSFIQPVDILYVDFISRGNIVVVGIFSVMFLKMTYRAFYYTIFHFRDHRSEIKTETVLNIFFVSGFTGIILISIITPTTVWAHESTIGSLLFFVYIAGLVIVDVKRLKMYHFLEEMKRKNMVRYRSGKGTIELIMAFIENNYAEDIRRDDIAYAVNITPEHLSRIFKKATGKTLVDHINETRINNSKQLLANTNKTIIEIALLSGFNSPRTYNRAFTKLLNINPTAYRLKYSKNNSPLDNCN
jgi:AraC-like DNA-binding protein